jgi:hypothetical protein
MSNNANDILHWTEEQLAGTQDERRKKMLEQVRREVQSADPSQFVPGSAQHTLALYQMKKAKQHAMCLGYTPPEQALKEAGLHAALHLGLGL